MRRAVPVVAGLALLAAGCARPVGAEPLFVDGGSASSPAPPARPPRVASGNGVHGPLGDVIDTGLPAAGGKKWVVVGVTGGAVDDSSPFGFAIGVRESDTVVTEYLTISEHQGSATAPGFHPMQGQMELDGGTEQPAFGYYVGTPATISVVDGGRPLAARLARWSHDPAVIVFWFDPAQVRDPTTWSGLGAYDAGGKRLPDGHIELFTY